MVFSGLVRQMGAVAALLWALAWTLAFYVVVWSHEMGHVFAARHMGVSARRITLWPLGGLAHLEARAPSPGAEMFIAAAGPAVHLIWFLAAGAPYFYFVRGEMPFGEPVWASMLGDFVSLQVVFFVFNLLPFWPMDGGVITRGFLAKRMHPTQASLRTAWIGFAGAGVLGITAIGLMLNADASSNVLVDRGWLLLMIAIGNAFACQRLMLESKWGESPYEAAEEPWRASIPQAQWNASDESDTEEALMESVRVANRPDQERKPRSDTPRKAARRSEESTPEGASPKRAARRETTPQERMDELLDRINEAGGVERLTDAERRELSEIGAKLRRGAD